MAVANSNAYGFFISNGDFGLIREVLGEVEERSVKLKRRNRNLSGRNCCAAALQGRAGRLP